MRKREMLDRYGNSGNESPAVKYKVDNNFGSKQNKQHEVENEACGPIIGVDWGIIGVNGWDSEEITEEDVG